MANITRTCINCRRRKVRCDGIPDGCSNCTRLQFECSFTAPNSLNNEAAPTAPGDQSPDRYTQAGTARKRARRACKLCHAHKARCSADYPSCRRCRERGVQCTYRGTQPVNHSPSTAPVFASGFGASSTPSSLTKSPSNTEEIGELQRPLSISSQAEHNRYLGLDKSVIVKYVDAYFEYVSSISCGGFLHRALFLQAWNEGTLNASLLKAVCAASIRFCDEGSGAKQLSLQLAREAESFVLSKLATPSVVLVEILMVVISKAMASRQHIKGQVLAALAARLSYILKLNHENESLSVAARESRRRLMWAIFSLDKLYACGIADLTLCRVETLYIQLPCNERAFGLGIAGQTGSLRKSLGSGGDNTSQMGIQSYLLRLYDMRDRILRYTRGVIAEDVSPYESRSELAALESELAEFKSSLPETMELNTRNLNLRGYTTSRTKYIMLHIWWYQCHCDLYRFMIPQIRESISEGAMRNTPESYVQYCQQKAAENALSAVHVFSEVKKLANAISIADPVVAICCYQFARIIVMSYMMTGIEGLNRSNLAEIDQLYVLVNVLEDLIKFYPHVAIIGEDIKHMIQSMKTDSTQNPPSTAQSPRVSPMNIGTLSLNSIKRVRVIGSRHGLLEMVNSIDTGEDPDNPTNTEEIDRNRWLENGGFRAPDSTNIGEPVSECVTGYGHIGTSNPAGNDPANWPLDFDVLNMTAMEIMLDPFANIHEDWSMYQFSSNEAGGIFE